MIDSMDYTVGSLVKVRGREWVVLPDSSEDLLRPLGGQLPAFEREQRVARLGTFPRRLLVATDCLSEGVNLQDHFNAVVHYDLSWNPTRHEQREGRVDRYGQPSSTVRTLTYYGVDNQIDGIVLEVLLRKHRTIRSSLGISVAVPASTQEVVQALMQGVMLRGKKILGGGQLNFLDVDSGFGSAQLAELNAQWENATEKERISRTLFAQSTLDAQEVAQEWAAMRDAIGSGVDVRSFVTQAVQLHGGTVSPEPALDCWRVLLPEGALQDAAHGERILLARFELPVSDSALYLSRTHPLIEDLAAYVVSGALDPVMGGFARRCGAMRTQAVTRRTTLLLLRFRHHLVTRRQEQVSQMLAEESLLAAFEGAPEAARWLSPEEAEHLLSAVPESNIAPQQATHFVGQVTAEFEQHLRPHVDPLAVERAKELLAAHRRVRAASRQTGVRHEVTPICQPMCSPLLCCCPQPAEQGGPQCRRPPVCPSAA